MAALAALAALALAAPAAYAQSTSRRADRAFKKGRDLFRARKYAEACAQFQESERLDPQMGTLFNLAQCDEKIGKLASAISAYREVVAKDTNAKRKALAAEYAVALAPRVAKVVVQVEKAPPGLAITLDAKPVEANQPIEVDSGAHVIVARADGYRELRRQVTIVEERHTTPVPVTLEPVASANVALPPPYPPRPAPITPRHHSHRKMVGVVVLGAGGAALVAGAVFGVLTTQKWNDAKAVCGGTTCPTQALVDQANQLSDQAQTDGNVATALLIGGGVAAAVGFALWMTAPGDEHAVRVSASVTSTSTTFVVAGRF